MVGRVTILWLSISLLAFPARGLAQTPEEQYELARNAFTYQDYDKVIALLAPLLDPEPRLPTVEMVLQAREWLGAALWWKGDKVGFKQQVTRLLQGDAAFELDSFYYPPEMVKEFSELKTALGELNIIKTDKPVRPKTRLVVEKTVTRRPAITNWLPFGIGQFVNGKKAKGGLFLAGQLVFLGANIAAWSVMYARDLTGDSRTAALAVMYGGLGGFGALWIGGIVDSYRDFKPVETIQEKRMELPEESGSMMRIVPFAWSGGGGLGLTGSF
jgi:hypothetical protein